MQPKLTRRTRAALCLVAGATLLAPLALTTAPARAEPAPSGVAGGGPVVVRDLAIATYHSLYTGDRERFTSLRSQLSANVALQLGLDAFRLHTAWAQAGAKRMTALLAALGQLGTPYRSRQADPMIGFDCSGLTSWAWAQAGVALPHQSGTQIRAMAASDLTHLAPGDILYYPGHVMMSLGVGGAIVDAANHEADVRMTVVTAQRLGRYRVGNPLGAGG
jgi:hypothetical protein